MICTLFLGLCYNEKYILLGMLSLHQVILKFILFAAAKKYKLAITLKHVFFLTHLQKNKLRIAKVCSNASCAIYTFVSII
ncbi:MAG: hypothetical protein ACI8WT_001066 [Clostridium sp.]|jgi:hypothetical protein